MSEKYETHVNAILAECPDADPKDVAEAFAKYETEFYIPPQDAMRSILRRFKGEQSVPTNRSPSQGGSSAPRNTKKVSRLSELNGNDKEVTRKRIRESLFLKIVLANFSHMILLECKGS